MSKMLKTVICAWLYFILIKIELCESRRVAVYPANTTELENLLALVGVQNNKIYIRNSYDLYELEASDLRVVKSASICSAQCNENSLVVINENKNVFVVFEGTENGTCSLWNLDDLKPGNNYNVTTVPVAISALSSRRTVPMVTDDGSLYVGVTYGPGIKTDRFSKGFSFHETYKFVISRITLEGQILYRDKSLPFRLPNNVQLDNYLIFFKDAFEDASHVYFVTNQKFKVGQKNYVSKLLSICKNDPYFYTYTDIVLNCEKDGKNFNLIQSVQILQNDLSAESIAEKSSMIAGIFAPGDDPDHPGHSSAICLYHMKDIYAKLLEAREKFLTCPGSNLTAVDRYLDNNVGRGCWNETLHNVSDSAKQSGECTKWMPLFSYVIGEVSLSSVPVFMGPMTEGSLTKIDIKTIEAGHIGARSVLLYAGTSAGRVLTMNVINATLAHVFDEITVDPGQSIRALRVDDEHNIYAMSNRKLVKYTRFDCRKYKNCDSVIRSYNPFCAWCVYQNRSVPAGGTYCQYSGKPNHLVSFRQDCPSLELTTDNFEIGRVSQVFFHVENFPEPLLGDEFYCEFDNPQTADIYFDLAKRGENGSFTCNTPNVSRHSPAILKLLVSTTSVHMKTRHNVTLAVRPVLFYDCRMNTNCNTCIENPQQKCTWHLKEGHCKSKRDTNETDYETITEPWDCPYLTRLSHIPLFHVGAPIELSIEGTNLFEVMKLECCTEGSHCSPAAAVNQTLIQCNLKVGDLKTALATFPLQVKYEEGYLDIKEPINVTVYDCRRLVSDCSQCRALNTSKFQCEWCGEDSCMLVGHSNCTPTQVCPPPVINQVHPATVPLGGGTLVTMFGKDMGTSFESITAISLAGIPCSMIKEEYVVSKTIVCETGDASNYTAGVDLKGNVLLTLENYTVSALMFEYKNPNITRIYPTSGPQAGGTIVTLAGYNLSIGNRNVGICFITNNNRRHCEPATDLETESITAPTPPSHGSSNITAVEVVFDGKTTRTIVWTFEYLQNPVIDTIHPTKSILSGGIKITVFGQRLWNAHRASISVTFKSQDRVLERVRECEPISDKQVLCKSPNIDVDVLKENSLMETRGSANLDGVSKTFMLNYFNDPDLTSTATNNSSTVMDVINGHLYIEGNHLTSAATLSDFAVTIGESGCHIVSLNDTLIVCSLPKRYTRLKLSTDGLLPVNIFIGDFQKTVGYISHNPDQPNSGTSGFSLVTVGVLSVAVGLLGIFVLVLVGWKLKLCVKKNKAKFRYLTMHAMGTNDTPILPSGQRRQSNGNDYEVINDLLLSGNITQDAETRSPFLKKTNDETSFYQTIDDNSETEIKQSVQSAEINPIASESDRTSLLVSNSDDVSSSTALKDYYLSPVSINRLKEGNLTPN